jgi:hypothetical protein
MHVDINGSTWGLKLIQWYRLVQYTSTVIFFQRGTAFSCLSHDSRPHCPIRFNSYMKCSPGKASNDRFFYAPARPTWVSPHLSIFRTSSRTYLLCFLYKDNKYCYVRFILFYCDTQCSFWLLFWPHRECFDLWDTENPSKNTDFVVDDSFVLFRYVRTG